MAIWCLSVGTAVCIVENVTHSMLQRMACVTFPNLLPACTMFVMACFVINMGRKAPNMFLKLGCAL